MSALWSFRAYIAYLLYLIHLLVYCLVKSLQAITWRIQGITKHLQKIKEGENYESSAQLLRVWHRFSSKTAIIHQHRHFITTHHQFVHPDYALQKHIVLMTVNEDEAIFCVPRENNHLFDTKKHPFLFLALSSEACYLLVMPTTSLIKLAQTPRNIDTKVILLHHPGRCGSTALSQVFNDLPNTLAISEPYCLLSLTQWYKKKYLYQDNSWRESDEFKQLFRSAVRLLLKPTLKPASLVLVKQAPMCSLDDSELLREYFPEIRQLCMYRDNAPQVTSLYRIVIGHDVSIDMTRYITQLQILFGSPAIFTELYPIGLLYNASDDEVLPWMMQYKQLRGLTLFGEFVLNWISFCYKYRKMMGDSSWGKYITAFRYEDMQEDRERFMEEIFASIGVEYTEEMRSCVMNSLDEDSQQASYHSQSLVRRKRIEITREMVDEANCYLSHFNLPLWGESIELPNTRRPHI